MTGSIVTFDDAIPFMPIEKLVAQIEPQQDLHGYDAPWAAGAGKNLLPMTLANMKTINTAGTWNGNAYTLYGVTYTVNVDDGGNVVSISATGTATQYGLFRLVNEWTNASATTISGTASGSSGSGYRLQVESNGTVITQDTGTQGSIPANTSVTRVIIVVPNGVNPSGAVFKPMIRLSTDSDTTFAPYSNECPITGWTGLSGGVSPCVPDFVRDGIQDNTGAEAVNPARIRTDYLPISLLDKATNVLSIVSDPSNDLYFRHFYWYTESKTFISNNGAGQFPVSISKENIPSNAEYFRLVLQHSDASVQFPVDVSDWKIAINANPITVSWQSEAGTVYGGTVDVVSGVLTVDTAVETENGGNPYWQLNTGGVGRFYLPSLPSGLDTSRKAESICNVLTYKDDNTVYGSFFVYGGPGLYVNKISADETLEQFKTRISNPALQIIYPLATPQTYQLTPQQIETLLGNNTVFVDTGDVSVTYQSTSGSTPVRTSLRSPLASYSYNSLKLFGNTFIEHGKG